MFFRFLSRELSGHHRRSKELAHGLRFQSVTASIFTSIAVACKLEFKPFAALLSYQAPSRSHKIHRKPEAIIASP
jgi:hypothetical protein